MSGVRKKKKKKGKVPSCPSIAFEPRGKFSFSISRKIRGSRVFWLQSNFFKTKTSTQKFQSHSLFPLPQAMAMAAFSPHHTSFMTTANPSLLQFQTRHSMRKSPLLACRSSAEKENTDSSNSGSERAQLAKLAVVTLAAGMLALGSAHDAIAAKSAGRVGGQAFRSAAPKSSGPRINNSRTNIYVNPPIAPPLVGGYGYGVPYYGGWGWSPFTFFAPGPSVAVGIGGFDVFAAILLLAAVSAVIRRFRGDRDDEEDDY